MSTLGIATTSTEMRTRKFNPPWLLLGLIMVLIPLILIWNYLGSHFNGADGKMYLTLIGTYLRFGSWGQVISHNPLQGAWNIALPLNVWLNPASIPFHFMRPDDAKIWSVAICYVCYAASWYLLLRSAGVTRVHGAVISQFAFVTFDPFFRIFGWPENFTLTPWISINIALTFVVASLLLRISALTRKNVIINGVVIAALVIYSIYCDPLWTLLIYTMMAIPLAVVACEHALKPESVARGLALLLALAIVYTTGPGRFLLAMSTNTARYLEPAMNLHFQIPALTSTIFTYPQTKYEYLFLIVGWVLGIALVPGRARLISIVAAISFAAQVVISIIFLFVDVLWEPPPPRYYEMVFTGWYILGAGIGYTALISNAALTIFNRWKKQYVHNWDIVRAARVCGALISLSIAPGYLAYKWAYVAELGYLVEPWSPDGEMVAFLGKRVGLVSDSRFRGSVVIPFEDYRASLTFDTLSRAFIPTLNEYSQLVTQQMFVMFHELLAKGVAGDWSNRLPLFFPPTLEGIKLYVKVTEALGARFILSQKPLDFSSAAFPGMAAFKEMQFLSQGPAYPPVIWHLYELPATNTGDYSPTVLHELRTAQEMLNEMASPKFDFRNEAVVSENPILNHKSTGIYVPDETLVPLSELSVSFERGAAHVQGRSDGTSLALLPLQYSHCLHSSEPSARLVRADLAMVGIVFKGKLDTEITDDFGPFTPNCRKDDNADVRRLRIALTDTEYPGDAVVHPTAIKTAADFVPKVLNVLHQIK